MNKWVVPIRHTTYEPELTVGSGIRCVSFDQFDGGTDLGYVTYALVSPRLESDWSSRLFSGPDCGRAISASKSRKPR